MEEKPEKHKKSDKYWYYTSRWICVLCGYEDVYKYRRYDERPKDYWKRNEYIEHACSEHFM